MPSIFLSHTSVDKPFVEKLARDLKRLGVNVWYDKWEIKVGDSITWKVEDGIRENDYLGIVLSQEALNSEWVKSEISGAWIKQMQTKKVVILPIYYRQCNIPYFLADRKYADFRSDYQLGLEELADVFGISQTETISKENWRKFTKTENSNWQEFRKLEFEDLVTTLVDRAMEYNWSSHVGATKNPFSITFFAKHQYVSFKLSAKTYAYISSLKSEYNPNHLKSTDYNIYVGNSINECEEFLWRKMEDYRNDYGDPRGGSYHHINRFPGNEELFDIALRASKQVINDLKWYKGNKL